MRNLLALAAALLLVSCSPRSPEPARAPSGFGEYDHLFVIARGSSTAPPYRNHKRGDRAFECRYVDDREEFDSARNIVLRHDPDGRDVTARVVLNDAERDTLYALLVVAGFFDAPRHVGSPAHIRPGLGRFEIEARVDSIWKAVTWEPTWSEFYSPEMRGPRTRTPDPQEPGLAAFVDRLGRMLERRASYRELRDPPPRM